MLYTFNYALKGISFPHSLIFYSLLLHNNRIIRSCSYEVIVNNELFLFLSAVVCPKLTVPDNGGVVPSSCAQTDVEYGTRCVFYCGDGYALSGPRYTTCQDDTSWSEIAPLSCVRGQFLILFAASCKN